MGPKRNVAYIKPDEPAFLKRIKQQIGYKEGPDIDTKREALPEDSDEDSGEREDEKPQVVVLNSGDLTAEEAREAEEQIRKQEDKDLIEKGKIVFKPPSKRNQEPALEAPSGKKLKTPSAGEEQAKKRDSGKKPSLLSFEEED